MDEHIKVDAASQRRIERFQREVSKLLTLADKMGLLLDVWVADANPPKDGIQAGGLSTNHDNLVALNETIRMQVHRLREQGYRPAHPGPELIPVSPTAN